MGAVQIRVSRNEQVEFVVPLPESTYLRDASTEIQLGFVEREQTPRELMRLSFHLHLAGLLLLDTVCVLKKFGVEPARSTVHNWVQKAELQLESGNSSDHVSLDETVIQLTGERYWLFAAVDPETNELLHVRLFPTRNTGLTGISLDELSEKHDVDDAVFLVDSADWLKAALHRRCFQYRYERHCRRNSVERVSRK